VITLTLIKAANVVACIEQYGKDAAPHVKAYFVAKERQDKMREAAQEADSGAMIEDNYRHA
jgi:hypothetical protein